MPPTRSRQSATLENGFQIITVELPHLHTASLSLFCRVGSRYETEITSGISHFLEHMLFRGAGRYPTSFELNLAVESLGGTLHAETARDYSLYQMTVPPEGVAGGLEVLGEILRAPHFGEIELERRIVLEEINEDLNEDGEDENLDDLARAASFRSHPLGWKITGTPETVASFGEEQVRQHFRTYYTGRNLILAVAGPVAHEEVVELARARFGGLVAGEVSSATPPPEMTWGPVHTYVESPGSQTAIQLLFRAVPEPSVEYPALVAMARILDDGMSTRVHRRLCDQSGLAYYASASIEPFHDTGLFQLEAATSHARFPELVGEMLRLVDGLLDEDVTEAELAKAKLRYRHDLNAAFDDVEAVAGWFGSAELYYPAVDYQEKLARMEAVTAADVRRVAEKVFRPETLAAAMAGSLSAKGRREAERLLTGWRRAPARRPRAASAAGR